LEEHGERRRFKYLNFDQRRGGMSMEGTGKRERDKSRREKGKDWS